MKKWISIALFILAISQMANAEMVFNRGNGIEPHTLDPQLNQGVSESTILRDMYTGLVTTDNAGNIIPGVAKSWEVSEDGITYTFHLRESKWSNGDPVTAEDFVFAWQRAVDPKTASAYAFYLYPLKNGEAIAKGEVPIDQLGVTAVDDYTLKVVLENPTPYFLSLLTGTTAYPNPTKVVKEFGDKWTMPEHVVSNGPFKMSKWQPNNVITLSKNDHFYDADSVKLDKVNFYPITDSSAELKRYRTGELDYIYKIGVTQLKWIRKNLPSDLKIDPYLGTYFYGFNLTKPPLKDNLKLRKALNLVIDRDVITDTIIGAGQRPAYNFVPPGTANADPYIPSYAKEPFDARVAQAKQLYQEAGYSKENPLKVELLYNDSETNKVISIAVAAMWKQYLGVETVLINKDWKSYLADRKAHKTQVFREGWAGDYDDPNTFLDIFTSSSSNNGVGFNNKDYDFLIEEAGRTLDLKKRAEIFHQAEQILIDNYALLPIYSDASLHLIKPYVKGYEGNIMDIVPSRYITIEKH